MPTIEDLLHRPAEPEPVILDLLHRVIDPEVGVNIVDLGLVRGVKVDDAGNVFVEMTLTTPSCPLGPYMIDSISGVMGEASWTEDTDVEIVWEPLWNPHTDMTAAAKQQLGWPS